jgi:hypothetical protein
MLSASASDIPSELQANLMRSETISSDCRFSAVSVMLRPFVAERAPEHGNEPKANHLAESAYNKLKYNSFIGIDLDIGRDNAHLQGSSRCNAGSQLRVNPCKSARVVCPIFGPAKFPPGGDILGGLAREEFLP